MDTYKSAGKIKILHIITRLERGGAPSVLLEVLRRCNRKQFEHHIATGISQECENDMISYANDIGIQTFIIPSLVRDIKIFLDLKSLAKLYFLILKGKYNIIHCHTSKGGFIGRLAARLANAKVIVYSPHGDIFEGYFGRMRTYVFTGLEKFAALFTDKIITLTKKGIEPYIKAGIGSRKQFDYVYNGIDIEALEKRRVSRIQKRQELRIENNHFLLITAGRLVPVKGHTYLIDALAQVVKYISNVRLIFLGDGELRQDLFSKVKMLKLGDHVSFLGMRKDVPEILSCSDLFVLPSINEGFGVVLLEAMAMRCPVIATDVGGISEVVLDGKTGILVPPRDSTQLARAIMKLLYDQPMALQMTEYGYQRLKTCFDIRETVSKTENLYKELLRIKD